MFGRNDADRHIREQIARDGAMPQRIERYFIGVECSAYTDRRFPFRRRPSRPPALDACRASTNCRFRRRTKSAHAANGSIQNR